MNRKRGAVPSPRHRLISASPHKIVGPTPQQFLWLPKKLSMWLNDIYGDCVTAEEAFAKACYQPEIFITDQVVQGWAKQHWALEGQNLINVLDWMEGDGFHQDKRVYRNGPNSAVDWTNTAVLQNAISYGPVKIGVAANQLDNVVPYPPQNGWFATGFREDKNEDHCTSLCGYGSFSWLAGQLGVSVPQHIEPDAPGYAMFTWSSIGIIDPQSMLAITQEAWLRNPVTIIG